MRRCDEIRSDNHYLTPEIGDMLVGCSTRLEEFTSGIVEGSKSDDSDTEVMKLKMVIDQGPQRSALERCETKIREDVVVQIFYVFRRII
jgi:hypothetical protein